MELADSVPLLGICLFITVVSLDCVGNSVEGFSSTIYASRFGADSPKCGSQSSPCKSIFVAVSKVRNWDDLIYIDGTGTGKDPYTCDHMTSQSTGIYIKNSISILGYHAPVYVKCGEGLGIFFTVQNNSYQVTVNIANMNFENSPLSFKDCSVAIEKCSFTGKQARPINVTQATHSVSLSVSNSVCAGTYSCFAVAMEARNPVVNHVAINITDTLVADIIGGDQQNQNNVTGTGLFVYTPKSVKILGSILADITLSNVIFTDSQIGAWYGLFFMKLPNGHANIYFDKVTMKNMRGGFDTAVYSIATIQSTKEVIFDIYNSTFVNNTQTYCLYFYGIKKTTLWIRETLFTDNSYVRGSAGILITNKGILTGTELDVHITESKFIRNCGEGEGCFFLISSTTTVTIEDCAFERCFEVFSIVADGTLTTTIKNSQFLQNQNGILSLIGRTVIASITKSVFAGTLNIGTNGILDIDCRAIYESSGDKLLLDISDTTFENYTTLYPEPHGALSLFTSQVYVNIYMRNTTFKHLYTNDVAGAITLKGEAKARVNITIVNSAFQSIYSSGYGGAVYILQDSKLLINIVNSSFINCEAKEKSGGALYVYTPLDNEGKSATLEASFTGCVFASNHAYKGSGGAIHLNLLYPSNITFTSCEFLNNTSPLGSGGGVYISSAEDEIEDSGCLKKKDLHKVKYRKWKYKIISQFIETTFQGNRAQSGGAVFASHGRHIFHGCQFKNNFAALQGGHLGTSEDSTSVEIDNTRFEQTERSDQDLSFISTHSAGPLVLNSTVLDFRVYQLHPVVRVSNGGLVEFSNDTSVLCAHGSRLEVLNFTNRISTQNGTCFLIITVLQFTCNPCPMGEYSIQRGHSQGLSLLGKVHCIKCPFGADCAGPIKAQMNFWGYKIKEDPPALNFSVCPAGYCERPAAGSSGYNACQGNRASTLCGSCGDNYTETLISSECRRSFECHDTWLFGLSVVLYFGMALYLIIKPPIFNVLLRHIFWFKQGEGHKPREKSFGACDGVTHTLNEEPSVTTNRTHGATYGRTNTANETPGLTHDVTNEELPCVTCVTTTTDDGGYLKIVFYFYQVASLLLVSASFTSLTKQKLLLPLLGLFNFQVHIGAEGLFCPFPGLTSVTKQLLMATQVFMVLGAVILCYLAHRAFRAVTSLPPPSTGPYIGAVIETLLLGYAVLVSTTLKLLHCVSIATDSRLFIAGDVICYQWWQYLLMVLVGVNVVPFIFVLAYLSRCLKMGTISAKQLIIACIFPLPFLLHRLLGFLFGRNPSQEDPEEWKTSVQRVLIGPFRTETAFWESVLIGRRFVLIVLHVTIPDSVTRQISLSWVCVLILLHHSTARSFQNSRANTTETASLLTLVTIALLNLLDASFMSLGQEPEGTFKSLIGASQWVQVVLLSVMPALFVVMLVTAVISQLIRLLQGIGSVFCSFFGIRGRELQPLLD